MPKEEKREESGEKGEEEKGILGKLKKLFMPEEEKGGEAKAEKTRAKETMPGETEVHEIKVSEVEIGKERAGEETKKPYTYEFYHEIGKKGGEERAREIREEGISPETHEKLSEAGHKGGEAVKETHGREFYQEIGRKGGAAPKGAARREVPKGEVIVRRSGKDLDVMFSSQEEAEEWRNRFASMMEQEGYHLSREKPETMQAEAEAATGE